MGQKLPIKWMKPIKMNIQAYIVIFLLGFIWHGASAQVTVSRYVVGSLGGDASVSSGITYMYNVGEVTVETKTATTVELTQGFEQPPYELDTSVVVDPNPNPNPVDTAATSVDNNAFSPNGDGVNDTWYISRFEVPDDNIVTIYNRWGDLIWRGENYDNVNVVWDGTNNSGEPVTGGTYFYTISITNSGQQLSGWLQVTKE